MPRHPAAPAACATSRECRSGGVTRSTLSSGATTWSALRSAQPSRSASSKPTTATSGRCRRVSCTACATSRAPRQCWKAGSSARTCRKPPSTRSRSSTTSTRSGRLGPRRRPATFGPFEAVPVLGTGSSFSTQMPSPLQHAWQRPPERAVALRSGSRSASRSQSGRPIGMSMPMHIASGTRTTSASVRTYVRAVETAEPEVRHFRTHRGDHEIDLIVERAPQGPGGRRTPAWIRRS